MHWQQVPALTEVGAQVAETRAGQTMHIHVTGNEIVIMLRKKRYESYTQHKENDPDLCIAAQPLEGLLRTGPCCWVVAQAFLNQS